MMITKENFAELIRTIDPEILSAEIEKYHEYILMEVHIFNVGGYATVESADYSEELEEEADSTGNLFCDKDTFLLLIDELNNNLKQV